jgi:hypothetical protein
MVLLTPLYSSDTTGISLFVSLAFGLGQCGIGMLLALRSAQLGGWRSFRPLVLALIGAGFALSGVAELVVSGAEALGAVTGTPNAAQVRQIRFVADGTLAVGLAVAALTLASWFVWRRIVAARDFDDRPTMRHS